MNLKVFNVGHNMSGIRGKIAQPSGEKRMDLVVIDLSIFVHQSVTQSNHGQNVPGKPRRDDLLFPENGKATLDGPGLRTEQ